MHSWLEWHCSLVQLTQACQAGSETSLLFGTIGLCPRVGVLTVLDCNAIEKGGKKAVATAVQCQAKFPTVCTISS